MIPAATNKLSHVSVPYAHVILNFCEERLHSRVSSSPAIANYFSLAGRKHNVATFLELNEFYLFAHVASQNTSLRAQQNQQERNCLFPFFVKINDRTIPHEFTPPFATLRSDDVNLPTVNRPYTICINPDKNISMSKRLSLKSQYPLFSMSAGTNLAIIDFEFCPTFASSYHIDFGFIIAFASPNEIYRADELLDDLVSMTLLSQQVLRMQDGPHASK